MVVRCLMKESFQKPADANRFRRGEDLWKNGDPRLSKRRGHKPSTGVAYGISVVTTRKDLAALIAKVGPKPFKLTLANTYTDVMEPYKKG